MTAERCARAWEAEALDDGRLTGADRASFERHAAVCAVCRAEVAALAALRAKMAVVAAPEIMPLDRQRLRARTLERANATSGALRSRTRVLVVALGAVGVVGTALAFAAVHARRPAPVELTQPIAAPRFDAKSSADARWLPHTSGGATRIELTRGSVSFTVPHLEPTQKFFVGLPDGELEVRGTEFTVVVHDGRTASVDVASGRVALRLKGSEELLLAAGERWPSAEPAAAFLATADAGPAAAAHPSAALRPTARARPTAGALFDEAFASFERGAYGLADAQLEHFIAEYPSEPRAEDAAYLRAVARSRLGDREGAAVLARRYLDAYPAGLRRPDAQRLADRAHP